MEDHEEEKTNETEATDSEGNPVNNHGDSSVDPRTENSSMEECENGGGEGEREQEGERNEKEKVEEEEGKEMDLFQLVVVNSYGSQEVQKLKDNDQTLKLSSKMPDCYNTGGTSLFGFIPPQAKRTSPVTGHLM